MPISSVLDGRFAVNEGAYLTVENEFDSIPRLGF